MAIIKRWLSGVLTGLLVVVLFGIIFVRLELATLDDTFFTELGIVAALTAIVRVMWYDEGEDKAFGEEDTKKLKSDYAKLIDTKIQSQESLERFVDKLNKDNREKWVLAKLRGRTEKNCTKYSKLKHKYIKKSYKKVPTVTSTQILTRSYNYAGINAKDYTRFKKIFYQITSVGLSLCSTILLGVIAYKELIVSWTNVFRYLTYIFNIMWALASSYMSGYKTYKSNTTDHISRLTMIVTRYDEWVVKGESKWDIAEETQATEKTITKA